ncbi:hypothetical protein ACTXGQ_15040 [Marinobacter sp. 1Y8]
MKSTYRYLMAFAVVAVALITTGCMTSSSTEVMDTRSSVSSDKQYESLLVLAVTANRAYRDATEKALADSLIDRGFRVFRLPGESAELPWDDKAAMKALVSKRAKAGNTDGVLVVTLVRREDEKNYVPTQVVQRPVSVGIGTQVSNYMQTTVEPGYYNEKKVFVLKTTLYDVETEQAVWELYSNTVNPASLSAGAHDFAAAVAEVLSDDVKHGK